MILSDKCIKKALLLDNDPLVITPLIAENIQPASVDLTLHDEFIDAGGVLYADELCIAPNQFLLVSTVEHVEIPNWLVGTIEGKSSLGRKGLQIHMAGYIDPGFKGKITLQVKNHGNEVVFLKTGNKICQLSLHKLSSPALEEYGHENRDSKYQNQTEVTVSKYTG